MGPTRGSDATSRSTGFNAAEARAVPSSLGVNLIMALATRLSRRLCTGAADALLSVAHVEGPSRRRANAWSSPAVCGGAIRTRRTIKGAPRAPVELRCSTSCSSWRGGRRHPHLMPRRAPRPPPQGYCGGAPRRRPSFDRRSLVVASACQAQASAGRGGRRCRRPSPPARPPACRGLAGYWRTRRCCAPRAGGGGGPEPSASSASAVLARTSRSARPSNCSLSHP